MSWGISEKACWMFVRIPWLVSAYAIPLQRIKTLGMTQNHFVYFLYIYARGSKWSSLWSVIVTSLPVTSSQCSPGDCYITRVCLRQWECKGNQNELFWYWTNQRLFVYNKRETPVCVWRVLSLLWDRQELRMCNLWLGDEKH